MSKVFVEYNLDICRNGTKNNKFSNVFTLLKFLHLLYTGFHWKNMKERDHLEDISVDSRIHVQINLK
jgi:hypothetical protein